MSFLLLKIELTNVIFPFVFPRVCICDSYSVLVRGGKFCPGSGRERARPEYLNLQTQDFYSSCDRNILEPEVFLFRNILQPEVFLFRNILQPEV